VKLFSFNTHPQTIRATYVALTEKGIIYCNRCSNLTEAANVLPYDMVKYLRVDLKAPRDFPDEHNSDIERIGHTFIEMNDEKEITLVGEDNVRVMKELR